MKPFPIYLLQHTRDVVEYVNYYIGGAVMKRRKDRWVMGRWVGWVGAANEAHLLEKML